MSIIPAEISIMSAFVVVVVFAYLLDCCIEFALASTGDKNIGTFVDESLCSSKAYPAVSACDDCDFSFKLFHDFSTRDGRL